MACNRCRKCVCCSALSLRSPNANVQQYSSIELFCHNHWVPIVRSWKSSIDNGDKIWIIINHSVVYSRNTGRRGENIPEAHAISHSHSRHAKHTLRFFKHFNYAYKIKFWLLIYYKLLLFGHKLENLIVTRKTKKKKTRCRGRRLTR